MGCIQFVPRHSLWGFDNVNATVLHATLQGQLTSCHITPLLLCLASIGVGIGDEIDPSGFGIDFGTLERPFNACEEVEVLVKRSWCGQFVSLEVFSWVSDARAL